MSDEQAMRDEGGTGSGSVIDSGAWAGAVAVMAFLMWADRHMPWLCGWLLNSAVILGVTYGMARWKRAWYGWLCFWAMVALCAVTAILKAATPLLDSPWSDATWVCAGLLVGCWYWLVRVPRRQPSAQPREVRVIHEHHHVLHAPGWSAVAARDAAAVLQPGQPAPEAITQGRPVLGHAQRPGRLTAHKRRQALGKGGDG